MRAKTALRVVGARLGYPVPLAVGFEITHLCNLACGYCDRHTPMVGEMTREQIFRALFELNWEFHKYNTRGDIIAQYLAHRNARSARIPYRANRAIIFDSRYFHKSDALDFSSAFENRRVNVTLLFGRHDRQ